MYLPDISVYKTNYPRWLKQKRLILDIPTNIRPMNQGHCGKGTTENVEVWTGVPRALPRLNQFCLGPVTERVV